MGIPCIDWKTGYPLTCEKWYGGAYTLVENYVPPMNVEDIVQPEQNECEKEISEDDYVVIDGKRYNKDELRSLLE